MYPDQCPNLCIYFTSVLIKHYFYDYTFENTHTRLKNQSKAFYYILRRRKENKRKCKIGVAGISREELSIKYACPPLDVCKSNNGSSFPLLRITI